jgi:THUMP domain-like
VSANEAYLAGLRSDPGRELIGRAVAAMDAGEDLVRLTARLRAEHADAALVAAVLDQAGLRVRARAKFGDRAARMFFTSAGLEQATRPDVATHRARRFGELAPERTVDLCCGIGSDLIALGQVCDGSLTGIDHDPRTVEVAAANIEESRLGPDVTVRLGEATQADLGGVDAAFIDPGRRSPSGRRTFDPRSYSPPFGFVTELASAVPATCAKLAPGFPHDGLPVGSEAEWVSSHAEVTELALWFGPLASGSVRRRATLLPTGATVTDADPSGATVGRLPAPGDHVHEPDGAVIRAGLVGAVVAELDGWLLDPAIAYVVTGSEQASAFTRSYRVLGVMPFQLKRLRAHLRSTGTGDVVVKKRGNAVDPQFLRSRLRLEGDGPTRTLLLTRVGNEPIVVIADPVTRPPG